MVTTKREYLDLLSSFNVGMLNTATFENGLQSRPMAMAHITEDADVYLIAGKESHKVEELRKNKQATLTCQDSSGKYLTLAGSVVLSTEPGEIERFWNNEVSRWFPEGKEEAVLIKLKSKIGEYWDLTGLSRAKFYYEMAKSKFTDSDPDLSKHHGEVQL